MLRNDILEVMDRLKLRGMQSVFDEPDASSFNRCFRA
jgi:hypothetical protein